MLLSRWTAVGALLGLIATAPASAADSTFNVVDYGAPSDGKTLCTSAIQETIDACRAKGGGTVRFPPGKYLTGALRMKSGVALSLDEGATLLGSRNLEHYYGPEFSADGRPVSGPPVFRNLIQGENLDDITIRGRGTIDGNGSAFRDKSKPRTKAIYFVNCRNVRIENIRLRSAGSWMQHYRQCENVVIKDIDVFNHVAFNNDGLNIDSCRNVTITGCRVDSDDDGIVLKSLSDRPCQNVTIAECTVSSHCNALKMGTESGGGFIDITIRNCTVFSPRKSKVTYGRQRGLAGIALEIVDGGRMENVSVSDIDIEGVSVPIFLRLGNRARRYGKDATPGVGTLRRVRLSNITARKTSSIGCSITGLPGHPIEDVTLSDIRLGFDGGGTQEDTQRTISERESSYPESTMFGTLPAYGFYFRHAKGLRLVNVQLRTDETDLRHAMMFDDVEDVEIEGLDAQHWSGAGAMLRMRQVRNVTLRHSGPQTPVATFLQLEGSETEKILLEDNDLSKVDTITDLAQEVAPGAVIRK